jgi:hypothetical protein
MDLEIKPLKFPAPRSKPLLRHDTDPSTLADFNQQILKDLTSTLEQNPTANLLDCIPKHYQNYWAKQRKRVPETPLSAMGKLNKATLSNITHAFQRNPECDLLKDAEVKYYNKRSNGIRSSMNIPKPPEPQFAPLPDFREKLEKVTHGAAIAYPLSPAVSSLLKLSQSSSNPNAEALPEPTPSLSATPGASLTQALKELFRHSENLTPRDSSRIVLKCNDEIAVKVVQSRGAKDDFTEYTSLQYLEKYAPEIPSPRPLGLATIGSYQVIFMTYIPSQTLQEVWPNLTSENKTTIRDQLGHIFSRLRRLQRPDDGRQPLGSTDQQHLVKDHGRFHEECDRRLFSAAEFEDWKWSFAKEKDPVYIQFIRGFLNKSHGFSCGPVNPTGEDESSSPSSSAPLVFTHGDVGPHNILVKETVQSEQADKTYEICAIIDWEYSGFYPEPFECQRVPSSGFGDWILWVPECISPWRWPVEWFVEKHLDLLLTVLTGYYRREDLAKEVFKQER